MTDRIEPALTPVEWKIELSGFGGLQPLPDRVQFHAFAGHWAIVLGLANHLLPDSDSRKITRETVRAILSARTAYPLGSASHRELIQIAAALASLLPPDQQTPDLDTAYAAYLPPE